MEVTKVGPFTDLVMLTRSFGECDQEALVHFFFLLVMPNLVHSPV
jgi:hypothetical protein